LAARYDQMHKNYKMTMEEFVERGFTWVASEVNIKYNRGILLDEKVLVRTQMDHYKGALSIC